MKDLIVLKEEEEEYEDDYFINTDEDEDCELSPVSTSPDPTVTVKPAITKPGKNETKVKCTSVRAVIDFREETEGGGPEDVDCKLTVESDPEVTVMTMKPTESSSKPSVMTMKPSESSSKPSVKFPDTEIPNADLPICEYPKIEPKLARLVTLYSVLEEDCSFPESFPLPDVTVKPEIPADFVPQCGRHQEEGYLQSISRLDPEQHETQFGEWPSMCAILQDGQYIAGQAVGDITEIFITFV